MAERCQHHPNTPASGACAGCKKKVCATCLSEGRRGFCQVCVEKALGLGQGLQEVKPGMAGAGQSPAPGVVRKPRGSGTGSLAEPGPASKRPPTGDPQAPLRELNLRDPANCFLHHGTRAAAKCITCNRAYCPACLNSANICAHCTTHKAEAQAILFSPNARGQAVLDELAEQEAKKRIKLRDVAVVAVAALGLVVAWKVLHKAPEKVDPTTAVFQKLHQNDLSEAEQAQLSALHGQRRVAMPTPPPTPVPPPPKPILGGAPLAVAQSRQGGLPTYAPQVGRAAGGAVAQAVRVSLLAPGTVRGVASIGAAVSGRPGRVDFLVDGAFVDSRSAPPYRFSWASQAHGNGPHTLSVEARGEAGLLARASRRVTVAN